ncbi:MAG: pyruvate kinase [Rhodopirellula sp.]|nr:pyruvate kinase [Rhodopirellula sp.]HCP84082.1 pyruvate kinase [Planctomycetaceae bacterium]
MNLAKTSNPVPSKRARTKIVATVGPASVDKLQELLLAGVDVFRVNMAHGTREQHQTIVDSIRSLSKSLDIPVGILIDLAGPKIRLGELFTDPIDCVVGTHYTFTTADEATCATELTTNYAPLIEELSIDDSVMLADGTVEMKVIEESETTVTCRVVEGGILRSRQGVNLPGVNLSVPALTVQDRDNAVWATSVDADFISLSFVRAPLELLELKALLEEQGSQAMVIAKVEKREAMQRLDEIVLASDAVMVARGDLGVEIDVAETPIAQKRIIQKCHDYSRPVIVATQMLDSMQHSTRPTRAEVTDVANAILDGADACMLSGETAIGTYPVETVRMMNRIMLNTEATLHDRKPITKALLEEGVQPVTSAIVYGAARVAEQLGAKLVVVATRTGNTARIKANQKDFIPTVGVSRDEKTLRQLCLYWGIIPLGGMPIGDGQELRNAVEQWGKQQGLLIRGDSIVFVTSSTFGPLGHDMVFVHEIED